MKTILSFLVAAACFLESGCASGHRSSVFAAVDANDVRYVRAYLHRGGDPNAAMSGYGSLLYIATGPHGGKEVLHLLLAAGADPNRGLGRYTPLMNAASWLFLDGCKLLIEAGADPELKNERGQNALECAGYSASPLDQEVRDYLRSKMKASQPVGAMPANASRKTDGGVCNLVLAGACRTDIVGRSR